MLTAIDLFAGAGGFSLAAQQCGIDVRAAVEFNKHACATYRRNLVKGDPPKPALLESDISTLDWRELLISAELKAGDCDVLMGGPPCQGFSTHRLKGSGVSDPRNKLLLRYFDAVQAIRPRVFIVENVLGLLWDRHASHLEKFFKLAKSAGYFVRDPLVLNARDFGVPQNRKRVFLLGIREDVSIEPEWPPHQTHFDPQSPEVRKLKMSAWRLARDVFKLKHRSGDPNDIHMNSGAALVEVFKSTPANGGSRADSNRVLECHAGHDGHKDVYGRIDPKRPGPTMTTACINPSKGRFLHPTAHHGITLRQAARFQGFSDDFTVEGGLIAGGIQVGNAVPIQLGKAVLNSVKRSLELSSNETLVSTARIGARS